ncbi:peptide chain release factor N(5)-glutamine methyltransferase [Clostridium rectalis]|uniref:peptide chain release factor N(5)-glutamine methyltransferase n=1 Tax=Clostridium rectalis TaxID=2040295 RepID=UPI000F62C693|nr:peptide chain release factor N(5)-glutamine methyltransferase [Clostridium rectalis]
MKNCRNYTIGKLLEEGIIALKSVGIESYILDCRLLLGKVIDKDNLFIMLNRDFLVEEKQAKEYFKFIEIRKEKMPIKYILGKCEFMGLDFEVKQGVLIPRPDTEILVEEAISIIKEKNYKNVCDVCCGSGIIGISIGKFVNNTKIDCFDISDIAVETTGVNLKLHNLNDRVNVFKSDLLNYAIDNQKKYDIIVSNPPYIREEVIPTLMEDVKKYEPFEALSGGKDGLYFYKKILEQSKKVLNKDGRVIFEIGHDQKEDVTKLLLENGFKNIISLKDLAGWDRVVGAMYK